MLETFIMNEAAGSGATGGMSVTPSLTIIQSIVNWVVDFIGDNPVLMVFFVGGLIPVGIKVFKKIKNSVK